MNKELIICILICLQGTEHLYAQWTEKDSLWLQRVLSGQDTIRLNPETRKAIEEGLLIRPENPFDKPLDAPSLIPLTIEFTDSKTPDEEELQINPNAFQMPKEVLPDRVRIKNSPFSLTAGAQDLLDKEVKDGQRRGTVGASARVDFSLDDILCVFFKRNEWRKRKNRKRMEALKQYNTNP